MRRLVHPVCDIHEVPASEMSASSGSVFGVISNPSNVFTSNADEIWHSFRFAPVSIRINLGQTRRLRSVCLLPNMYPASAIVRHSLTLWDSDSYTTHVYQGHASDSQWICIELNNNASIIEITTIQSPSWVSWRQIQVFES